MEVADNIILIREKIAKARKNAPLAAKDITLLAASKGQSAASILDGIGFGVSDFGENRVQEAAAKWPDIKKSHPGIRLHLIGPLQSNKVKEALDIFDVIQTIDRKKLIDEIVRHSPRATHRFYIQVNTGKEPQKAGVMPEEAGELIEYCRELSLPVAGLMCIPPAGQLPAPHFALLYTLAKEYGLSELSMGMSEDFETAIRMGATCIRIGRALFGAKN